MPLHRPFRHYTYECNRKLVEDKYRSVLEQPEPPVEDLLPLKSIDSKENGDREKCEGRVIYEAAKGREYLNLTSDEILSSYGISDIAPRRKAEPSVESRCLQEDATIDRFLENHRRNRPQIRVNPVGMNQPVQLKLPTSFLQRQQRMAEETSLDRRVQEVLAKSQDVMKDGLRMEMSPSPCSDTLYSACSEDWEYDGPYSQELIRQRETRSRSRIPQDEQL